MIGVVHTWGLLRVFTIRLVPVLLLVFLGPSPMANAQEAEQRLQEFLSRVQSMEADFKQTLLDENARPVEESAGRFYLHRPDRFRWDYTLPYPQVIVADGSKVWTYDSELEQVTVRDMGALLEGTPAVLLGSGKKVRDSFVVEEDPRGIYDWMRLIPRASDSNFTDIRIALDGDKLRMMELEDTFGQTTRLRFSRIRVNPQLSDDLFTFVPPEGVDVITDTP